MGGVPLFPESASTVSGEVDALYFTLIVLSALFVIPIIFFIVYFGARYRRGAVANRAGTLPHQWLIETTWIVIPLGLAVSVFVWAAQLYFHIERPPASAIEIYVIGKQWMWETQHPGGQREIDELHVPVNRPIKLIMTSQDVIHSFYVPAFRVKQDVLPGRYTTIWFQATETGEFRLNCAEYCGLDHAVMGGRIVVLPETEYQQWLAGSTAAGGQPAPQSMATAGEHLFISLGCSGCHRMDGSGVGPSLAGIYGRPVPLEGGQFATVDEGYIRDSIVLPQSQIVAGYQPIMPSFQGQVSEGQILELIAFIKSLGDNQRTQTSDTQQAPAVQSSGGATP